MRTNTGIDWSYLLLLPHMGLMYTPWVGLHARLRFVAPLVLIWLALAISRRQEIPLPRKAGVCLAWAVILILLHMTLGWWCELFGHGNGITLFDALNLPQFLLPLFILHLSVRNGRLRELAWLVLWCLLCVAATAVMTIRGEQTIEFASRSLTATGDVVNTNRAWDAYLAGVAGRSQVYAMALLAFPLLYCARFMRLGMRIVCTIIAVLLLWATYAASYSSVYTALGLGCILWLMAAIGARRQLMKTVGVVYLTSTVVVVAFPRLFSFTAPALLWLRDATGDEMYQSRIEAVYDAVAGKRDSYVFTRTDLYRISLESFAAHPWVGTGLYKYEIATRDSAHVEKAENVGGHSTVADILGGSGLLGLGIFVLGFVYMFRYLWMIGASVLGLRWWRGCYMYLFPFWLVLCLNSFGGTVAYSVFFLLLPGVSCWFGSVGAEVPRHTLDASSARAWSMRHPI